MDDLHARLKAAVEERLAVARTAAEGEEGGWRILLGAGQEFTLVHGEVTIASGHLWPPLAPFLVANDAATVIRMCERDLRVLERHTSMVLKSWEVAPSGALVGCEHCELTSNDGDLLRRAWPCDEITDMATAYGIPGEGGGG